ncbi:hypothetical protein [Bermanella sp. R86510]|uniref:hypothetical protein n=1 Tax=unclassified Bermanella TaxID=2627862 RepID=UPI0037C69671
MKLIGCLTLIFLIVSGCSNDANKEVDESKVVARVGDEYILQTEFDYHLNKLLGLKVIQATDSVKRKVLESIVISKLMSQKQLNGMSKQEHIELETKLNAYKEDVLTKMYLEESIKPVPPTKEQVLDYYNNNLDKFGGGNYASVEYWSLGSDCSIDKTKQTKSEIKAQLSKNECYFERSTRNENLSNLAKELKVSENNLEKGKAYWITHGGEQQVLFVNSLETKNAKPLIEVASDIRKMLAPMQLRQAIEDEKKTLIRDMEVEYFD